MALSPVNLTDTFDTWRTRTNQLVTLTEDHDLYKASNAFTIAALTSGNNYVNAATTSANNYSGNLVNAATLSANNYALSIISATSITTGTSANNFAGLLSNSSNGYAVTVGLSSNNFAGNLVNAATLSANNRAGALANTKLANTTGTVFGGDLVVAGNLTVTGASSAANSRVNPRVFSTTALSTPFTVDISAYDQYIATAQSTNVTFNLSTTGSPVDGNKLLIRIRDAGSARNLTFNGSGTGSFRPVGVSLTANGSNWNYLTTASKTVYFGCVYNSAEGYWDIVAISQQ